jgi:transposase
MTECNATIGLDLGDKVSEVCELTPEGVIERRTVRTTRDAMTERFTRPSAHVVLETGTHSRWVSRLLGDLGHQVTVANPRRVQLISKGQRKSDLVDAELLMRLGRADVELLSPVEHRGDHAQAELAVAKMRDGLVRCRTLLVNSARGIVKAAGERLPRCEAEAFHRRAASAVPPELKPALDPIFEALAHLEASIRKLDREIAAIAERHPEVARISQPAGVGLLTAVVFALTLDDEKRFKSRDVGAYVGLVPRRDQSGGSDRQLGITKAGDPFLRRLLVTSANYVLGPFGPDTDLRRWGLKLAERGGKNAKKRAVVAVARKLAVLMHRLWVTGADYQPLGHHKAA